MAGPQRDTHGSLGLLSVEVGALLASVLPGPRLASSLTLQQRHPGHNIFLKTFKMVLNIF